MPVFRLLFKSYNQINKRSLQAIPGPRPLWHNSPTIHIPDWFCSPSIRLIFFCFRSSPFQTTSCLTMLSDADSTNHSPSKKKPFRAADSNWWIKYIDCIVAAYMTGSSGKLSNISYKLLLLLTPAHSMPSPFTCRWCQQVGQRYGRFQKWSTWPTANYLYYITISLLNTIIFTLFLWRHINSYFVFPNLLPAVTTPNINLTSTLTRGLIYIASMVQLWIMSAKSIYSYIRCHKMQVPHYRR